MSKNTPVPPSPEQVVQMFLTPRRAQNVPPLDLPNGDLLTIETPEGKIAVQRSGAGPKVLLLHGWEGHPSDMAAFAPRLIETGFEVLALHLPAHGDSSGKQTCIPHSAKALRHVFEVIGPLHAAVAHSVGSAVLAEAMFAGLEVNRAVLIAAPAYYKNYARMIATMAGLDDQGFAAMCELLSAHMGVDIAEISLPARAKHLKQPALFFHSSDDKVVQIENSLASAAAWPGASHVRLEGLGHKRILSDTVVTDATLKFISGV